MAKYYSIHIVPGPTEQGRILDANISWNVTSYILKTVVLKVSVVIVTTLINLNVIFSFL